MDQPHPLSPEAEHRAAVARALARVPGAAEPAGATLARRCDLAADARALREADAAIRIREAEERRRAAIAIAIRNRDDARRR